MNIKTKLLEEYVNFVDSTKKQNKYFKIEIILLVVFYLCYFLLSLKTKQSSISSVILIFILLFV